MEEMQKPQGGAAAEERERYAQKGGLTIWKRAILSAS